MARTHTVGQQRLVEPRTAAEQAGRRLRGRLRRLEQLVRAIEQELDDEDLDAEQALANIAERVAAVMDGR